jgi:D-glycero-alpha-D-manno-heptose-7-phosphate kinase
VVRTFTPLRVPFAGGLTDLKEYAERFGGVTVSATIDRGAKVTARPAAGGRWRVAWGGSVHEARDPRELAVDLVRESALQVGYDGPPLELDVEVEARDHGGLGASGAVTVGVVHALRAVMGQSCGVERIAADAAHVEVERLGGASGYHDPHVCARGGLLHIEYRGAHVTARRLEPPPGFLERFEASLLFFETGRAASTKASLQRLADGIEDALDVLHEIKALGAATAAAFERGDLPSVARAIGEQQRLKQLLPGAFVDDLVTAVGDAVTALGASVQFPGGKVGAYAVVCCPDGQQDAVRQALRGLREVRFALGAQGTRLI